MYTHTKRLSRKQLKTVTAKNGVFSNNGYKLSLC